MERDWTPVLKGKIFCSPACGGHCTKKQHDEAVKLANALKRKLKKEIGGEWVIRVHENLGWHFAVVQADGPVCFHQYTKGKHNSRTQYAIGLNGGTPVQVSTHPTTSNSLTKLWKLQKSVIKKEADRWTIVVKQMKNQES